LQRKSACGRDRGRRFLTVAPYGVLANLAVVPVVGSTMILRFAQIA
jgi:hypothetical protein